MEPIRTDRTGVPERRTRKRSTEEPGGFFERLDAAAAPAPPTTVDELADGPQSAAGARLPDSVDSSTAELYDAVHAAGERLARDRTYTAAQQYRDAIARFLARVVPQANAVEIRESGHDILNRKRYFLLTQVNRAVDRLVQGLLSSQREQIDVLRRLEEVEGLLIDLIH